ncbi:hypothetical protein PG985_003972 [Apiospora marii]|uniref:uncharacterized protein n=1 Tax=Apiospora marii TaxID=335849 RepID=UPI0031303B8A
MEHKLRCNSLKCRKELSGRALSGLAGPGSSSRHVQENVCPACHVSLPNPDDAVIANLNPSEDYKTSVLSGLSPTVIMECAGRALSFWAYQTTQEVSYQAYLGKALADKYSGLTVHLDQVINDANAQITSLHTSLKSKICRDNLKSLREKNTELAQAYKDKNRKLLQVQELYDKLKRKAMLDQIQDAAEDAIESNFRPEAGIDDGVHAYGDNDTNVPPFYQDQGVPWHIFIARDRQPRSILPTDNWGTRYHVTRSAFPNHLLNIVAADIPITPSTHRQRLGEPTGIGLAAVPGFVSGSVRSPRTAANGRAPLSGLHGSFRHNVRLPTGGLSSGMKVGLGSGNLPEYGAASRPQGISPISHRGSNKHMITLS